MVNLETFWDLYCLVGKIEFKLVFYGTLAEEASGGGGEGPDGFEEI